MRTDLRLKHGFSRVTISKASLSESFQGIENLGDPTCNSQIALNHFVKPSLLQVLNQFESACWVLDRRKDWKTDFV